MFAITPQMMSGFLNSISKYIILLAVTLCAIAGLLIFLLENDYYQGISFKIMFIHVPAAWLSLMIFFSMGISSIIGLIFKSPTSFTISRSLSPIGLIMSIVVLITGSIWGNLTWGTYWVWDARLTSVAILFLIYLIIIFIDKTFENKEVREKTTAIFILIGSVNLPIIKFSVDWWNTLHQPASISKLSSPSIDISMLQPLLVMTIAFCLIGLIIAILRIKAEILIRKHR